MLTDQRSSRAVRALLRALAVAAALVAASAGQAAAQQAIIVVRHAEKTDASDNPGLSAPGMQRAKALAALLRTAGVTHIVASEFRRTRETAAPLATELGLTVDQVPARDLAGLTTKIQGFGADAIVLVVGHSNTIPPMLTALGWPNQLDLKDADYDNAFVLVPHPGQRASMVRLKYGKRTP